MIVYLQHDHNEANREQIKRDVKIINRNWQRARWQAPGRLMLKYSLAVSCLVMLCSWSIMRGLLLVGGLWADLFALAGLVSQTSRLADFQKAADGLLSRSLKSFRIVNDAGSRIDPASFFN